MLTVVFHVCMFALIVKALVPKVHLERSARSLGHFMVVIALTALGAAALHALEAGAWAMLYVWLGAMPYFPDAHVVFAQRDHKLWPLQYLPGGSLEVAGRHRGNERADYIWPNDCIPFCRH